MKNLLISSATFWILLNNSFASTFTCNWIDTGFEPHYYRPAHFNIDFDHKQVKISNDNYFMRTYTPCFVEGIKSCAFSFELGEVISIDSEQSTDNEIIADYGHQYGLGTLKFSFAKKLNSISKHEKVEMTLEGDDGDGSYISHDLFACYKQTN